VNTRNLLLEIGTEEIPATFIPGALDDLARLAREHLNGAHLTYEDVLTMGTPRRLVLCAKNLSDRQPDREEIVTGPPAKRDLRVATVSALTICRWKTLKGGLIRCCAG